MSNEDSGCVWVSTFHEGWAVNVLTNQCRSNGKNTDGNELELGIPVSNKCHLNRSYSR